MKITMAVRTFAPRGGAEKFSLNLAAFLRNRGHTVMVVALEGSPLPGVALKLLSRPRGLPRACRDWYTGSMLAAALEDVHEGLTWGEQKVWNAHVIRPGGGSERAYWRDHAQFSPAGRILGPGARYGHPKYWFDRWAENRVYRHPRLRRVIVNARVVAGHILANHPHLERGLAVVHNGTHLPAPEVLARRDTARKEQQAACGFPADSKIVLFAGHGFRRKGLVWALRALALAARTQAALRLVVVGRGRVAPYLKMVRRLGIEDRVAFAGAPDNLEAWYLAADVLLHPALFDPFANVTVEALAYGLPVVTTRANGGHEILRHGKDGWIVDRAQDVAGLAQGIQALLTPAARPAAMETARNHTLEDTLAKVENILQGVWEEEKLTLAAHVGGSRHGAVTVGGAPRRGRGAQREPARQGVH